MSRYWWGGSLDKKKQPELKCNHSNWKIAPFRNTQPQLHSSTRNSHNWAFNAIFMAIGTSCKIYLVLENSSCCKVNDLKHRAWKPIVIAGKQEYKPWTSSGTSRCYPALLKSPVKPLSHMAKAIIKLFMERVEETLGDKLYCTLWFIKFERMLLGRKGGIADDLEIFAAGNPLPLPWKTEIHQLHYSRQNFLKPNVKADTMKLQ